MAKNELSSNYKMVKELILDEQKLVTYISISKHLCIHINEAKNLLNQVLDEAKKQENNKLSVNYIISGLSDENSAKITVCPETELKKIKNSFKTIFFQHIYSVCKSHSDTNNAAIVALNKFEDFPLCPGIIKSNLCSKRTLNELGNLKVKSQDVVLTENVQKHDTKVNKVKKEIIINKDSNDHDKNNSNYQEIKQEPTKSEVISPKKKPNESINKINLNKNDNKSSKSIAGFFTKSNSASSGKASKKHDDLQTNGTKKAENKASQHLENFFTKSNSAPSVKTEKSQDQDQIKPKIEKKETEIMDVDVDSDDGININKSSGEQSQDISKKSKNKSLKQIKKNAKVDKRRKRVLHVSDSESDEDPFAEEKPEDPTSEDDIPPTPSNNTVKITSGILNPKKRRKVVDKTYTDEEGYILTRKEEVYESCSDEEPVSIKTEPVKMEKENKKTNKKIVEISPIDKKVPKNSKKKISPPQKGKQATLMNFFQKK